MRCFVHTETESVGVCSLCGKAVCRDCVAASEPKLICRGCVGQGVIFGFEYRSAAEIGGWPVVHICTGVDPVTMKPKIAKGIIAIGNLSVGAFAFGGLALGLVSVGGLSLGLLVALGGAALGLGWSFGGLAVGTVAIGGAALGFQYAIGGAAFGAHIIDGMKCDPAAFEFFRKIGAYLPLPPHCGK